MDISNDVQNNVITMQKEIAIIVLKYLEPYYHQTLKCLEQLDKSKVDIFFADRDGVGSMSRAYNDCFKKNVYGANYKYVWFVSNITFEPNVPFLLAKSCEMFAAVHPEFNSDHQHIRPDGSNEVKQIPFIEFTAPMIQTWIYEKYGLDEDYWYWFYDLIISKQIRESGLKMACDHRAKVGHVYLRNNNKEVISKIRTQLRDYRHKIEVKQLEQQFGKDWQKTLFYYG